MLKKWLWGAQKYKFFGASGGYLQYIYAALSLCMIYDKIMEIANLAEKIMEITNLLIMEYEDFSKNWSILNYGIRRLLNYGIRSLPLASTYSL